MAVRSSRGRALRKEDRNGSATRNTAVRWDMDALADSGLDTILSSEKDDDPDGSDTHQCSESTMPLSQSHSSTWPSKIATKQEENRTSFCDLPAEIRISIYEAYCQRMLKYLDYARLPVGAKDIQRGIPSQSLVLQFVCHQVRNEFLPVWAQSQSFLLKEELPGIQGLPVSLSDHYNHFTTIWTSIRDLLDWMGPSARHHVRRIRVSTIWQREYASATDLTDRRGAYHINERLLKCLTTDRLVKSFERLEDVSEDLEIEVEFRCFGYSAPIFRGKRRIFTLRQCPRGRSGAAVVHWSCRGGQVESVKVDCDVHITEMLRQRPFCWANPEDVWQPGPYFEHVWFAQDEFDR